MKDNVKETVHQDFDKILKEGFTESQTWAVEASASCCLFSSSLWGMSGGNSIEAII